MGLGLPSIATLLLLVSGFLARNANRAFQAERFGVFATLWRVALLLGGIFVLIMAYEWTVAPMGTQYGSVFRLMTGFHGFHALVIGLYMAYIYQMQTSGHAAAEPQDAWPVEAGAKLWYFVVIAWMMFYTVLYWI